MDAFDDMNLREDLLRGIYAYGFEKPSAIQQRAILPCIGGNVSISNNNFVDVLILIRQHYIYMAY